MTETTDIAEVAKTVQFDRYVNQPWTDLASGAAVVPGADLIPGALLRGVPFVITSATFRPSDYLNLLGHTFVAEKTRPFYVSLEVVTGDDDAFAKARKRGRITDDCPIDPGEELVFNESGTGVYRQVVSAFEAFRWIKLPEGPLEGAYGESRLDVFPDAWEYTQDAVDAGVETRFNSEGALTVTAPIWLNAKRGLRVSEYENDFTKEGVTRYLA